MSTKKHTGSCHCGAVKFEVEIDATRSSRCNCTVCTKLGGINAIAKPEALRVEDESECGTYRWGGTLTDVDPSTIELTYWDGRHDNWEAGPHSTPWPIVAATARS